MKYLEILLATLIFCLLDYVVWLALHWTFPSMNTLNFVIGMLAGANWHTAEEIWKRKRE